MKIGYTIWTWGLESENNFISALKELKELGYSYFENFIGMADLYYDKTDEFNKIVKDNGFEFIAIYNYIRDMADDNLAKAEKYLDFCKKTGAKIMNIQAPPRNGKPSKADLDQLCDILSKIGRLAKDYGVTLCLHPHFETTVEQEDEIDYVADRTDPQYLSFCFDTAHTVLGGMDISKLFKKYKGRIDYIHIKDQDPAVDVAAYRKEWKENFDSMQRFSELGSKGIDFPAVVKTLKDIGYDGFLVVELDTPTESNYVGAKVNRKYIAEKLGM
ncbi:MAG: sugar phosphate isomerase/epimerase family protein [Ruminiclostridium sp.]